MRFAGVQGSSLAMRSAICPAAAKPRSALARAAGLLLVLASAAASGKGLYEFGLRTDPAVPVAGKAFELSLRAQVCNVFWSGGLHDREIEVVGTTVRVIVEYTAPAYEDGCDPGNLRTVAWSIDPLAAGVYTLVLFGNDPHGRGMRELGRIPLTVSAAVAPRRSRGLGKEALMFLLLGLLLTTCAWWVFRARR